MADETGDASEDAWTTRHLWQFTPLQDAFWIGLGVAVIWFGYVVRGVFIPLLIALGLAYAVNPLLNIAESRWKLPRSLMIGLILTAITVISASVAVLLVPILVEEIQTLASKAPDYAQALMSTLNEELDESTKDRLKELRDELPRNGMQLAQMAFNKAGPAVGVVGDLISSTLYVTVSLFLIPIYFVYFASQFHPLLKRAEKLVPDAHHDRIMEIAGRMDDAVGSFLRGRILIMFCMMMMFSTGFWLAGVPYWFLLGILIGLLSFVPYLAFVGCLVAVLVKWVDVSTAGSGSADSWIGIVVWPVAAYSIVQLIEGWLLTPWIQSRSMEMSAVAILIVVFIGGAVGGLYGLLLAIPVAGCVRILCTDVLLPKLEAWAEDT